MPGHDLHLRLPAADVHRMRLLGELRLRHGLRLRQELMTNCPAARAVGAFNNDRSDP